MGSYSVAGQELPIVEDGPVPVYYVDDILLVEIFGPNFRVTFYEKKTVDGVEARVPRVTVIEPIASYRPLKLAEAIQAAQAVQTALETTH